MNGFDGAQLIALVGVVGGISLVIIYTVTQAITRSMRTRQREQSRREIAAYVAEGSMTAEEGERLIAAGERPRKA